MFGLGTTELLIVLAVVMLVFGSSRLPRLARSLGQAKRELEQGLADGGGETVAARPDADRHPAA